MTHFNRSLQHVDQKSKDVVFGFLRHAKQQFFSSDDVDAHGYYNIPDDVIRICLIFYFVADKWHECGTRIQIVDELTIMNRDSHDGSSWHSAIGQVVARTGLHEWEIQINKTGKCSNIVIGVAKESFSGRQCNGPFVLESNDNQHGYVKSGKIYHKSSWQQYADTFEAADVVKVMLDLRNKTLSYGKNGKNLGVAYTDIQSDTGYRLAVCMDRQQESVTLLSYLHQF